MNTPTPNDPFSVLGLPREASEEQIRARYLEVPHKTKLCPYRSEPSEDHFQTSWQKVQLVSCRPDYF